MSGPGFYAPRGAAVPRAAAGRLSRRLLPLLALALGALPARAQVVEERLDLGALARIRDEAFNRSRVMEIAGYLTDVIGPRPQGSSNLRRANDWTAEQLRDFGLANVTVEPWGRWGRGWERVRYSANLVEPWPQPLIGQPMAWSGSTRGTVRGPAVILDATDSTSFQPYRGTLRGAFVLLGEPPLAQSTYADPPVPSIAMEWPTRNRRFTEEELHGPDLRTAFAWSPLEVRLARRRAGDRYADLIRQLDGEGIAALLLPSTLPYGIIRVAAIPGWHDVRERLQGEPVPALVVSHDQYGQMYRNVRRGVPVELEAEVRNRFLADDLDGYNTLADLPGTDLAHELVMFGGHLDSWHAGTGATDNGAGVAVAMEAMRILKTLGLQGRRTIRVGLWTAEEGRHLGVAGWIAKHRDQWSRISVYLNLDTGHGRIRGLWNQSNPAVVPIFRQIFEPLRDLGVSVVREGDVGGNEHQDFDDVGVPGFTFLQDPMEYVLRSHHSSADTFERLVADDLKQAAAVLAWTAFTLANRDAMIPRKSP